MTEHTPTPWRDPGEHPLTGYGDINHVIAGSDGTIIGSLYANCFGAPHMLELPTVEQAGANAALIVRAVNNHEALVKALERLLDFLDNGSAYELQHPADYSVYLDARALLDETRS